MSQENVEIVRRGYDLWNHGEMEAWADLFAPDATVHPREDWTDSQVRHGREEILRLFRELREPFERPETGAENLVEADDRVVAAQFLRGVLKGSEDEFEGRVGMMFRFQGGKIIEIRFFPSFAEALEAAGLRE